MSQDEQSFRLILFCCTPADFVVLLHRVLDATRNHTPKTARQSIRRREAYCHDCNRIGCGQFNMIYKLLQEGANVHVSMSAQDLRAFGLNLLSDYAAQETARREAEAKSESYLTPNQVCKLLGVNRSTLWRWAKEGYLSPITMGGRSRYTQSSITKIMEERV